MSEEGKQKKASPRIARHFARWRAVQALYQWDLGRQHINEITRQFRSKPAIDDDDLQELLDKSAQADMAYFETLLRGVLSCLNDLDGKLQPQIDRALESVDPIERAILRVGCYELAHRVDIPYRVVINEAVELTKEFGAEQGHKFVNGVLDKTAQQLRSAEVREARAARR